MLTPSSAECPLFTERRAHVSFFYSGDGRLSPCLSVMQGYHAKPCKASLELINVLVASSMPIVACSSVHPFYHNSCIYAFSTEYYGSNSFSSCALGGCGSVYYSAPSAGELWASCYQQQTSRQLRSPREPYNV
jgi:hypothetical protein